MKDFPLVLPLVPHGKSVFSREALIAHVPAPLGWVCCHMPFRAHAPTLQMLLLPSARASYRPNAHSCRKERIMCILKDVRGKFKL